MKIAHIMSGDLWAGAEVQLFHLVTKLAHYDNIKILVILFNHGKLEKELNNKGIKVVVLDESELNSFQIFVKLNTTLKQFQADVVHTHRNKENILGGIAAKLSNCRSIRTVHGASEFSVSIFKPKSYFLNLLDKIIAMFFQQKIIAVSDELKQKLSTSLPEKKLLVINNFVDIKYVEKKSLERLELKKDSTQFDVVFVGRFVQVKRVDKFYQIALKVLTEYPMLNIHFHMLGDGPLISEIKNKIVTDKLDNKFHLAGFVNNTAPYIKQMDLLCFTSDHEGLPMTLLESIALETAVISRHLPTIKNVLCDGNCGTIINSEDEINQFACAIAKLAKDKDLTKQNAILAKQNLLINHSVEATIPKYIKIYTELT